MSIGKDCWERLFPLATCCHGPRQADYCIINIIVILIVLCCCTYFECYHDMIDKVVLVPQINVSLFALSVTIGK